MQTVHLFQQEPEVKAYYQRKFQYIHVDEYQDTNHVQYQLVKLLAEHHQNICVVGDFDQSIYRFRGADISNILDFEKDYPQAKLLKLEQNYRSTKNILEAANHLIAHNTERKPKKLWTENDHGDLIQLYEVENEHVEAAMIIEEIQKGVQNQNRTYQDYAVLYRTNAQSRVVEEMFRKAMIPYQVIGGFKFYDRKEVKDILAYLRVVVNPDDSLSLLRIINVPKRGIGATTIEKIEAYRAQQGISFFRALLEREQIGLSRRALQALDSFVGMIRALHGMMEFLSAAEMLQEVLRRSGYVEELQRDQSIESLSRLENIEELHSVVLEFERNREDRSLLAFLTELALVADVDLPGLQSEEEKESNVVSLMTLHSAKGLEFPQVFLIGMEEHIFPHQRSLDHDREIEEERRLAYVGITRAQERLILSRAKTRTLYGQTHANPPSRFLQEIPAQYLHVVQTTEKQQKPMQRRQKQVLRTAPPSTDWKEGDRVKHRMWGVGVIVQVRGENEQMELDVAFANQGVKRLLALYAPIEKCD
jgi:DNA helicase-2/ATP-dependent DNA helicase PcrA